MIIRRFTGWAAPAAGVSAVLAAVVGVTYANESRVNVSMPGAAVIVSAGPTGENSTGSPSGTPGVTLVYPKRSVDVLPGADDSATPAGGIPSATGGGTS
ncbi:MAG: hypothetical protein QOJ62_1174, partial [Actinomycetota bacterium]|nr:hypothetical protein [Actinomycetota bacterium]